VSGRPVRNPDFESRIRESFRRQGLMETLRAEVGRVAPGEVEITLPVAPHIGQQDGFVHGGAVGAIADSACGYAALTLMPADARVLTVEYKLNFVAPARGEWLVAVGRVVRAGRTITVAQAEVFAEEAGARTLVALATATLIAVPGET
jgi:uncharacterized protein (TIGR00369 family)